MLIISFGLTPAGPLIVPYPVPPNQSIEVSLPLAWNGPVQKMNPVNLLQVAVKNSVDVFYYQTTVPLHVLFAEDGLIADQATFMELYQDGAAPKLEFTVQGSTDFGPRFEANNVFLVHQVSATVQQK